MKRAKWFFFCLIGLIILAIPAASLLLNPTLKKLKPEIVNAISVLIGAQVTVEDISAQFLPAPKIELNEVALGGKNGARFERLYIHTSISELLSGKLSISEVTIDSPTAEIVKLSDGSIQIGDIHIGSKKDVRHNATAISSNSANAKDKGVSLKVNKLSITNGNLTYSEAGWSQKVTISSFSLALNSFVPDASSPIRFAFSLFGKHSPNISGEGSFVADSLRLDLPIVNLNLDLRNLDLAAVTNFIKGVSPNFDGITASGSLGCKLQVNGDGQLLAIKLELDATPSGINIVDKQNQVVVGKTNDTPLEIALDGNLSPKRIFDLNSFVINLGGSTVSGDGSLDLNSQVDKVKKLNINLQKVTIADLSKLVSIPVLNQGSFVGTLSLDLSKKPIPEMDGIIDISGLGSDSVGVTDLRGKLSFRRNLISSDSIDLSYKGENIKVSGDLLRFSGNQLDTPGLKVALIGGSINLENHFLNEGHKPFSGSISGSGIDLTRLISLSSNLPRVFVNGTLTKINSTYKGSVENIRQDLSATFSVSASKGEIVGVNIVGGAFDKIGSIPGVGEALVTLVPENYRALISSSKSTSFESFNLGGYISGGTSITLSKAELIHPAYLIYGSGEATTAGNFNLKTQLKVTKEITEGMVAKNGKLKLLLDKDNNLTFPLLISRDNGAVIIQPDISELGKNAMRSTAKDAASKALDKVAPGLGTGASKLLNKIF